MDYVENGKEAIEMLEKSDYDLILMDLQMSVMDGFEANGYIRNNMDVDKRDIPIAALTADVLSAERKKAFEVGMNQYVTKPFKPEELFATIHECVHQAQKKPANAELSLMFWIRLFRSVNFDHTLNVIRQYHVCHRRLIAYIKVLSIEGNCSTCSNRPFIFHYRQFLNKN